MGAGKIKKPYSLAWRGRGQTHVGLVRPSNQDAFAALDQFGLWIVADGMGGHAGGDVASRTAVETLSSWGPRIAHPDGPDCLGSPSPDQHAKVLRHAIQTANGAIRMKVPTQPHLAGMGTTVVVLHIFIEDSSGSPALATVAHVGDSRAYLLRDQTLVQLTRDHSWVEEQMRQGLLSPQEALVHPLRHVLTRALGIEATVEPELSIHSLRPDDWIVLCTDGLTKMLADSRIVEILLHAGHSADTACEALIADANRRGGYDNTTVLVVQSQPV